jgi:(5-formylfuran-3-yl)methyl phosphate synthase
MKLLVSVRDAIEASAALEGGADIIDAKDPLSGALGAVTLETFRDIHTCVAGTRQVTAALGDASEEADTARVADAFVRAGAGLVKIGFAGIASRARVAALLAAAQDGASARGGVIATAYADADRVGSLDPFGIVDAAARAGAAGVLLDTADKRGPGLRDLIPPAVLRTWVETAREARLTVALAGKLSVDDFGYASDAGADVVGVRGAACDAGRTGHVIAARVRELRSALVRRSTPALEPDPVSAFE